jgi:hypothetical protein
MSPCRSLVPPHLVNACLPRLRQGLHARSVLRFPLHRATGRIISAVCAFAWACLHYITIGMSTGNWVSGEVRSRRPTFASLKTSSFSHSDVWFDVLFPHMTGLLFGRGGRGCKPSPHPPPPAITRARNYTVTFHRYPQAGAGKSTPGHRHVHTHAHSGTRGAGPGQARTSALAVVVVVITVCRRVPSPAPCNMYT